MADNHGHKIAFSSASRRKGKGEIHMSSITVKDGTRIYYKDWGKGPVVTLSHGWPLSSDAWDGQMLFLTPKAFPAVPHDRPGTGPSTHPSSTNPITPYPTYIPTLP